MKTLCRFLAVGLVVSWMQTPLLKGQEPASSPPKYRMELIYIFESDVTEFVFVIGNSGFKTVSSLKKFIASLPPGSTLEWAPGCVRRGNEPLLSSEADMAAFMRFCEDNKVKFILVPSG